MLNQKKEWFAKRDARDDEEKIQTLLETRIPTYVSGVVLQTGSSTTVVHNLGYPYTDINIHSCNALFGIQIDQNNDRKDTTIKLRSVGGSGTCSISIF